MKADKVNPFKSIPVLVRMETRPFCGSLSWHRTLILLGKKLMLNFSWGFLWFLFAFTLR